MRAFYDAEGWQAVWSEDAEKVLRQALARRAQHGLDRAEFLPPGASADTPDLRETALTRAALAYASALARGLVDPTELHKIYTVPRPDPDLAAGLKASLEGGTLDKWLGGLAPQDPEYRTLSEAYLQLSKAAQAGSVEDIPSGRSIHQGESDPRVPQIAARLRQLGYFDERGGTASNTYDAALVDAMRDFQDARGLSVDGVVGPGTVQALNRGPEDRARAIAVALERRRWLQRNPAATRIDVNTAAATMTYFRDGQVVDTRKVIVGQPGWETPQLEARFYRLVANPTWTVPKSIESKQMGNVSAGYLRRHNMVRRDGWIVQLSGPDNALGLVKFDLDDDFAIYLHDTPEKSLFDNDERHRSHGCIRVHDALGFARTIAAGEQITGEWQQARDSGKETFVKLPQPIAVRLLYHPTWADGAGQVHFEPDAYGWNDPVGEQLGFGKGRARRLVPPVDDVGP